MRTYVDCIPCFLRQALDAVRLATDDEAIHERLMRETLSAADDMDFHQSPPVMGQRVHRRIRELTGQPDPYRAAKDRLNRLALGCLPKLRERVAPSSAPLDTALRLAIAGNMLDMGAHGGAVDTHIAEVIEHALYGPLMGEVSALEQAIESAATVLYLADNAGELVFDRLLLEQLPLSKVTLVVRGSPVINDATLFDAEAVGLLEIVEVVDNGSDAPGTILEDCSVDFRQRFDRADLVIAKGQGNYETLSHVEKNIFFALMVKCPVIARDLGCKVGSLLLRGLPGAPKLDVREGEPATATRP